MYRGQSIAVVIPAHNEEPMIALTLETMPSLVDFILVVDDASSDQTAATIRGVPDPRIQLLVHAHNTGVGGAIISGHWRAIAVGADISVVMDGDGQMDPAYLPKLLDPICDGTSEFSKGNRFFSRRSFRGMPPVRIVGNVVVSLVAKLATRYWNMFDPLNGYTAITVDLLRQLPLDDLRHDYSFQMDLLLRLAETRGHVTDVSIPAVYGAEKSGINFPSATLSVMVAIGRCAVARGPWLGRKRSPIRRPHVTRHADPLEAALWNASI